MAGKRPRQNNPAGDESSQSRPRQSGSVQAKNAEDIIGSIALENGSVMLYKKENPRNGFRLKVPPLVWTATWRKNLKNVPTAVLDFVCRGRRSTGDVSHAQEEPDFLEADFSLIKDPEFEYSSGGMQFEVSSVAEHGAVLLVTDQSQIEFAFSVRGNDIFRISNNFIAKSDEKDHVQYIGDFAQDYIKNIVEPKFAGSWKYTSQLKRPKFTTEVAYGSVWNLCVDIV